MAEQVAFAPRQIDLDENSYDQCMRLLDEIPIASLQLSFRVGATVQRLNIGAYLYRVRVKPRPYNPAYVDPQTIAYSRTQAVFNWAINVVEQFFRKLRPTSVYEDYNRTAMFLDWCDTNGHPAALNSIEDYHFALVKYSRDLCSKANPERRNTPQRKLTVAMQSAEKFYPEHTHNIGVGIQHPGYSNEEKVNTEVPPEYELLPTLAAARGLFDSISEFLGGTQRVPVALKGVGHTYWFFSCYYPVMSETAILHYQTSKTPGRILSSIRRDVLNHVEATGSDASDAFQIVLDRLNDRGWIQDAATVDKFISLDRTLTKREQLQLCKVAHDCFLFMFILYTEGNESPVGTIPWDATSSVDTVIQSFRTIKWRSHTELDLSFEARFLVHFRSYLRIREILVDGHDFGYLFGTFGRENSPLPLDSGYSSTVGKQLRRLVDPNLTILGFRELRAYHHHYKTTHHGVEVAAADAQHTLGTAITSYQAGNAADNIAQAGAFFTSFGLILASVEQEQAARTTQAGSCDGHLIPAKQLDEASIQPNCRNFLGCLFCESNLIHFNAQDAHKLLSMAYIIEQLRQLQISPTEHGQVFDITLNKIYWIIKKMEANPSLAAEITEIRIDVFEHENLTPYWQNKLRILSEIGVL
ncbi:hypothetical protein [Pseudomonas nunensis]|uniref:hypothetical protein n=1 Tax=Pseudomonas nunensis TaxID=2961896 RepID=UPI000A42E399|nr:hypothetical protein [Pseudomonas nunensis]